MRYTLIVILILIGTSSISQVTFISIPLDKQLIGRDPITNLGNIAIDGEVDNSNISYDSILIEVFRNNILHQKTSQFLSYSSHIASFNFNISIVAELVNYSLKIYGKSGSIATLQKQVDSIVAGDAYIIQGQSNAEARMLSGSANSNQNEFIRVYANGTHFKDTLLNNDNWYIGEGDGNRNTNGNTGQWGLKLARMLIDSLNIPIAIFNSGHGGKDIAFFQAPSDYQTSQESNYGRQYYRLNKTGLKDFVRAVFWSQGTWDGENYSNTSTLEYKNYFLSLKSDWLRDYPSLEKYYIFQTKNGCGGFLHKIKEAQRQLAFENQDISIMSTAALIHYEDDCHFPFINGYESFAKRIFPLVLRNFYGITTSNEIDPPMIVSANLINDTTLIVETDADELSIQTIAEDFE
ncbi:MAG TPA: sialate O-acetylesterase, partial [Bacteroidales bacterium]|nr:sialate O-acetylesterase [Bacteroidales bacterium]